MRAMLAALLVAVIMSSAAPRSAAVIPADAVYGSHPGAPRGGERNVAEPDQQPTGAPRVLTAVTAEPVLDKGGSEASHSPTVRVPVSPSGTLTGIASWYDNGSGLYAAAGPALRVGAWRGRWITVTAGSDSVTLRLVDWCACPRRLIDLSRDAFARLAPLSRGLVRVTIASHGVTAPTLPPTDT